MRHNLQCGPASQGQKFEIIEDHDSDTYRAVYTVKFANLTYVLHAFQKNSKRGIIATPKSDVNLIEKRLLVAQEDHKVRRASKDGKK